jgi:hypothetical protein
MMLRVVCPQCDREIFALPQSAGKVGQCACGGQFAVPSDSASPARRRLSVSAVALLIAASIGAGLSGGSFTGRRSAAPPPSAALDDGPVPSGPGEAAALAPAPAPPAEPPAVERTPPPASPSSPAPASFDARGLFLRYRDNPRKADELYWGKTIRVRGQLAHLQPDSEGGGEAGLVTFGAEEVPIAAYPNPVFSRAGVLLRAESSRRAELQAVESAAPVEVEGRCAGWRPDPSAHLGGVVVLEGCRLIPALKK